MNSHMTVDLITGEPLPAIWQHKPPVVLDPRHIEHISVSDPPHAAKLCIGRPDVALKTVLWLLDDMHSMDSTRTCAAQALRCRTDVPVETICDLWKKGEEYNDRCYALAAMEACVGNPQAPLALIEKGLQSVSGEDVIESAIEALRGRTDVPPETIELPFQKRKGGQAISQAVIALAAARYCHEVNIPDEMIQRWLHHQASWAHLLALYAFHDPADVPMAILESLAGDPDKQVRAAVFYICGEHPEASVQLLKRGMTDNDWRVRVQAYLACIDRPDVPVEYLRFGTMDFDADVCEAAYHACVGRLDVPLELLETGMHGQPRNVHWAAQFALIERRRAERRKKHETSALESEPRKGCE